MPAHLRKRPTPTLHDYMLINLLLWPSNPNTTSFVSGSPVFSRGRPAFTQSTCGHGGKQMWEPQEASLASQTFAAASRGDPVRQPCSRPSVSHVSTGFRRPSLLFLSLLTFLTLVCDVRYRAMHPSTGQDSLHLHLVRGVIYLCFTLCFFCKTPALLSVRSSWNSSPLTPSILLFFSTSSDICMSVCVPLSSCYRMSPHHYHSINIPLLCIL